MKTHLIWTISVICKITVRLSHDAWTICLQYKSWPINSKGPSPPHADCQKQIYFLYLHLAVRFPWLLPVSQKQSAKGISCTAHPSQSEVSIMITAS